MRNSGVDMRAELSEAELAALRDLLGRAAFRGKHAEIGTAAGGTLKELMGCYSRPRPPFVVIDTFTYFANQKDIVEANLRSAGIDPAEADFRAASSADAFAAAAAADERFDFIFVDADHSARHVIRDLRWARLLSAGGYLCLHDYGPKFPGVTWAVDRFLASNANYRRAGLHGTLVVIEKIAESRGDEVGSFDFLLGDLLSQSHRLRRSVRKRLNRLSA